MDLIGPKTLLLIGGLKDDFTTSSKFYSFDLSTKRWSLTLDLPVGQFRDRKDKGSGMEKENEGEEEEEEKSSKDGKEREEESNARGEEEEEDEDDVDDDDGVISWLLSRSASGEAGDGCRQHGAQLPAAAGNSADSEKDSSESEKEGMCYHATAVATGDRKLFVVGGEAELNRVMNPCLIEIDFAQFEP